MPLTFLIRLDIVFLNLQCIFTAKLRVTLLNRRHGKSLCGINLLPGNRGFGADKAPLGIGSFTPGRIIHGKFAGIIIIFLCPGRNGPIKNSCGKDQK